MTEGDIEEVRNVYSKQDLQQQMIKEYWILTSRLYATFDFVIWIARTEEIHVLAIEIQYIFAENNRDLWLYQLNKIFWDARHEALLCW